MFQLVVLQAVVVVPVPLLLPLVRLIHVLIRARQGQVGLKPPLLFAL